MRLSRTLPTIAALLVVAACSTGSPDLVAPSAASASTTSDTGRGGAGLIGSGNSDDSETTVSGTERGGAGLIGSGN